MLAGCSSPHPLRGMLYADTFTLGHLGPRNGRHLACAVDGFDLAADLPESFGELGNVLEVAEGHAVVPIKDFHHVGEA